MKTNRLPAWTKSVHQRMLDVCRLDAAIAANLKELGYGRHRPSSAIQVIGGVTSAWAKIASRDRFWRNTDRR